MIGQNRIQRMAHLVLDAEKNLLIVGPSGHGKTLLARKIAGNIYISLDDAEPPMGILPLFEWNIPSKRIVCDEIHTCNNQDRWAIFLDQFQGNVIFTTTNPEKVNESIKTRSFVMELDTYTKKELGEIARLSGNAGKIVAELSRGIPRRAENLGDLYREFNGTIKEFIAMLGVTVSNNRLLFPEEVAFLKALENGPLSKTSLERILNLANIEEVELSLLRLGLISITRKGRELNV